MEKLRIKHGSVAWVISRFIGEMNGTNGQAGVKPLSQGHEYNLRLVQRCPVGMLAAATLRKQDIIEHCRYRLSHDGVMPATVQNDITNLSGALKYAGAAWDDCEEVSDGAITNAKPFLVKHNLIAKSQPRKRRPSVEENERLDAYFLSKLSTKRTKINMVLVARWQRASARRISETCRLLWEDWNRENHTMLVRKMKDPRNRNKSKIVALPVEAQAMLVEMFEKRDPNEPRIFPYVSKSCSAAFTRAKKDIGIDGLRLHDSRRDCGTRLVEDRGYAPAEAILVTGHETTAIFERNYLSMKPELFKLGPVSKRLAQ